MGLPDGMVWVLLAGLAGAAVGGMLGGTRSCASGGCPFTANPTRGALLGALLGVTLAIAAGVGGGSCPFRASGPVAAGGGSQPSALPALTVETFAGAVAEGVVLVDFWAAWCGPCQRQLPILEALAPEAKERFAIVKVNVDEQEALAKQYGVSRLPTLIFFRAGQPVKTLVGTHGAEALLKAYAGLPPAAGPSGP